MAATRWSSACEDDGPVSQRWATDPLRVKGRLVGECLTRNSRRIDMALGSNLSSGSTSLSQVEIVTRHGEWLAPAGLVAALADVATVHRGSCARFAAARRPVHGNASAHDANKLERQSANDGGGPRLDQRPL